MPSAGDVLTCPLSLKQSYSTLTQWLQLGIEAAHMATIVFCCHAQGLGAINAVGKAAVHVATSLDNAVETLFEGWNGTSPSPLGVSDSQNRQQVRSYLLCIHHPQSQKST